VFVAALWIILPRRESQLLFGILSIPALHALCRTDLLRRSTILQTMGSYTFSIYLMNTMAIGFAKAILLRFVSWDGPNFYFVAPVLVLSGVLLPIAAKALVFRKIPILDRITT
jgi:hypothetical protein